MAKVTGPLMSMDASGQFGGAMVFGKWKGRNVVRQYTKPSNPQTSLQTETRNALRVLAAGQAFASSTLLKRSGETTTDLVELKATAPAGQAWNGWLVKSGIGAGLVAFDAAETAYAALTAPQKSAWDTAAAALTPAIGAVAQKVAGGASGTPMAAGQVFYHYVYALNIAGVTAAPTGVPPTYA